MRRLAILTATHLLALGLGFGLGVYLLPILVAPDDPAQAQVDAAMDAAPYHATFKRDLKGSDPLHWGEGTVSVSPTQVAFDGKLAPGPDYKVYLVKEYVETIADFERVKADAVRVGEVKSFNRFLVDVPAGVDVQDYTTVLVWCERFSKFISAAQYRTPG
ncbi:DM13 domain-containing protein [Stenotrophomonas sp.]|uniref:DM13 domain-containing protein n=1 Tax=Stenotrophomonas sp. TaxID=69392 RepID=UPI002FCA12F9